MVLLQFGLLYARLRRETKNVSHTLRVWETLAYGYDPA